MQAQRLHFADAFKNSLGRQHGFLKSLAPTRLHVQRQITASEQHVAGREAKTLQVQRRPVREGLGAADGVNARQEAAYPFQHFNGVKLWPPTAAAGRHAETEAFEVV